jgi:hypothetical protein
VDQIVLKRGDDERAIAVDEANPKDAYASARMVLDEWERTPSATTEQERIAQAQSRVNTAREQLAQAERQAASAGVPGETGTTSEASSATLPSARPYNTATNAPKGGTQKTTGVSRASKTTAKKGSTARKGTATKSTAKKGRSR